MKMLLVGSLSTSRDMVSVLYLCIPSS